MLNILLSVIMMEVFYFYSKFILMEVYLFHLLWAGSWGAWSSCGSLKPQMRVQMPKSFGHRLVRSKDLYDTVGNWRNIYVYSFSICFFISQEHFWYALLFCQIDWIFCLLIHISTTHWIEVSGLFFHSCFLSPMLEVCWLLRIQYSIKNLLKTPDFYLKYVCI